MATTILKNIKEAAKGRPSQHLINSIKYIMNPDKTEGGLWVGSNAGVTPDEIYDCMMSTKKEYGKENGRQGYHYVISFPPGACDEATCFKVGKEFCEAYFGDGYEYVFAVHNDHEHMHCHIVFNSVGRMDGSKYRYVNGDWEKYIQPVTDKITEKYGLGRLEYDKSAKRKGKSYAEHSAGKADKFTWKKIIRLDIDMAVSVSNNLQEYFEEMKRMGYDMRLGHSEKHGDYVSYHHPAMKEVDGRTSKKARRDYNLGQGYTYADIKRRIMQPDKEIVLPDTVYVKDKLNTITEHKDSRFQVCAVMRYGQASQYHYFDLQLKEQIRVRQDLINIDKLIEECRYILDNDIKDVHQAKERLDAVRHKIKQFNELKNDKIYADAYYDEDVIGVKNEYAEIYNKLLASGAEMTDEEYEKFSDRLEEIEAAYPDVVKGNLTAVPEYDKKLEMLYAEKRILTRIIKAADVTESVTQRPPVKINTNRAIEIKDKPVMGNISEQEFESVTESVIQKAPKGGL